MTYVALLFEVFLRPAFFLNPILDWINLALGVGTRYFPANCIRNRCLRSLLKGLS